MAMTQVKAGTKSGHRNLYKAYETSDPNTELTAALPATGAKRVRRLVGVIVHYSTDVSVSVAVNYNAGHGAGYDAEIHTIALSTADDGAWFPDGDVLLAPDDAIDVVAPAGGAGETAAVTILTEEC